eukprot:gene14066-biopygen4882
MKGFGGRSSSPARGQPCEVHGGVPGFPACGALGVHHEVWHRLSGRSARAADTLPPRRAASPPHSSDLRFETLESGVPPMRRRSSRLRGQPGEVHGDVPGFPACGAHGVHHEVRHRLPVRSAGPDAADAADAPKGGPAVFLPGGVRALPVQAARRIRNRGSR